MFLNVLRFPKYMKVMNKEEMQLQAGEVKEEKVVEDVSVRVDRLEEKLDLILEKLK